MYSSKCSGCYSGSCYASYSSRPSSIMGSGYNSNSYNSSAMYSLESRVGTSGSGSVPVPHFEIMGSRGSYASKKDYSKQTPYNATYSTPSTQTYNNVVDTFLNPLRPDVQFIDRAEQVEQYVRDTFFLTTGKELPSNLVLHIVPKEELKQIHELNGGAWSEGILGFSMNSNGKGNDIIFVKENELDRLMLVIGHEIGHVLSRTLHNRIDEEAKAFAFELAWMKKIVEHNIANLRDNIVLDFQPAENGLHNKAFSFVKMMLQRGKEALDIYFELVKGLVSVVAY